MPTLTFSLDIPPYKCSLGICKGTGVYINHLTNTAKVCDCGIDPLKVKKLEDEQILYELERHEEIQDALRRKNL